MKLKKYIPLIIIYIVTIIVVAVLAFNWTDIFNTSRKTADNTGSVDNIEMITLAYEILEFIRDEDFIALGRVVHPDHGVIFSPYATVNLSTDRHFEASQITRLDTDTNVYVWGVYNGSGEPIELTPAEYLSHFVTAAEFLNTSVLGINEVVKSGNALENMTDIYPDMQFVDFHISRGEPGDETNWCSLRLGFEDYHGVLRLIAIVYSSWTV